MIGYVGAIWQSSQIEFSLTITILRQTAKIRTDSGGEQKRITFLFTLEAKKGYAPHCSVFNLHQNHFSPTPLGRQNQVESFHRRTKELLELKNRVKLYQITYTDQDVYVSSHSSQP
jgi:hypothetical protein